MATADDFRKVACPKCGAKPSQVCKAGMYRGARVSVRPHAERQEAYLQSIPAPADDAALMAQWAKITDPREALNTILEQGNFLGYDPYYKDLRDALLEMAERCSVAKPTRTDLDKAKSGRDWTEGALSEQDRQAIVAVFNRWIGEAVELSDIARHTLAINVAAWHVVRDEIDLGEFLSKVEGQVERAR